MRAAKLREAVDRQRQQREAPPAPPSALSALNASYEAVRAEYRAAQRRADYNGLPLPSEIDRDVEAAAHALEALQARISVAAKRVGPAQQRRADKSPPNHTPWRQP